MRAHECIDLVGDLARDLRVDLESNSSRQNRESRSAGSSIVSPDSSVI